MRTGFVWHERYMWQETGPLFRGYGHDVERYLQPGSWFIGPEPKRRIRNLLDVTGVLGELTPLAPRAATVAELARVHSEEYIRRIEADSASGGGLAGPGTGLSWDSYDIACLSAGGAIAAVDAVLDGTVDNAYALVRPPGHHATRDEGLGLCIFANIPVAVRHLQQVRGVGRVAVVDWDVHHGNGTQETFYDDPTVLAISLHQANVPMTKRCSGTIGEQGVGDGDGYNLNIPLPAGSGRDAYLAALERVVVPAMDQFRPDFIIIASGLDASLLDPTGRMMLKPDGYRAMTQTLLEAAAELCSGRLVAVHEGGYSEFLAPFCGLSVIATMRGIRSDVEDMIGEIAFGGDADQQIQPHQEAAVQAAQAHPLLAASRATTGGA